ncbi:MAG: hypothetical protein ACKVP0_02830 [Pirellulaceae bacterium]
MSRFLVHWQKDDGKGKGLWPEDLNDVIQAPGRYSGWATVDCIIALNDVLQLVEEETTGTTVAGGNPISAHKGVIQEAISSALEQVADIYENLEALRVNNASDYIDYFETLKSKPDDIVRPDKDKMKKWQSHADRNEELFGLPRTITVTANDHERILGRSSLIEASLLGLQMDRLSQHEFLKSPKCDQLKLWLRYKFPNQLQPPHAAMCKSLVADTLRNDVKTSDKIIKHIQSRIDGPHCVPKPPKTLTDSVKQLTAETSQNIWKALQPYALSTNSMVLGDCFESVRNSPHLVVAWEHISNRGHGQDVLVDGDPVATLLCTATIVGSLSQEAKRPERGEQDRYNAESTKSALVTLMGVQRYLAAWLKREVDGAKGVQVQPELAERGDDDFWSPMRKAEPSSVFSLGMMARGILATTEILRRGDSWIDELRKRSVDNAIVDDSAKTIKFFRELFRVFYAHLLMRTFDIIVKERTSPFEPMPVRIVVGNEITHWPGVDVGLITYSLLHGRDYFDQDKALEQFKPFNDRRGMVPLEAEKATGINNVARLSPQLPLFQTLIALVQKGVIGSHNCDGAHQGFSSSARSVITAPSLRGAFITSGSNLSDEQSTTVYTWSSAHALSALVAYERIQNDQSTEIAQLVSIKESHARQMNEKKLQSSEAFVDLGHLMCLSTSHLSLGIIALLTVVGLVSWFFVSYHLIGEVIAPAPSVKQNGDANDFFPSLTRHVGFEPNRWFLAWSTAVLCAGIVTASLARRCWKLRICAQMLREVPDGPKDASSILESMSIKAMILFVVLAVYLAAIVPMIARLIVDGSPWLDIFSAFGMMLGIPAGQTHLPCARRLFPAGLPE